MGDEAQVHRGAEGKLAASLVAFEVAVDHVTLGLRVRRKPQTLALRGDLRYPQPDDFLAHRQVRRGLLVVGGLDVHCPQPTGFAPAHPRLQDQLDVQTGDLTVETTAQQAPVVRLQPRRILSNVAGLLHGTDVVQRKPAVEHRDLQDLLQQFTLGFDRGCLVSAAGHHLVLPLHDLLPTQITQPGIAEHEADGEPGRRGVLGPAHLGHARAVAQVRQAGAAGAGSVVLVLDQVELVDQLVDRHELPAAVVGPQVLRPLLAASRLERLLPIYPASRRGFTTTRFPSRRVKRAPYVVARAPTRSTTETPFMCSALAIAALRSAVLDDALPARRNPILSWPFA